MPSRAAIRGVAAYGTAATLCLILLVWAVRLWRADPKVPFTYSGDSILTQVWVKGLIENSWYLHNDAVGAPAGTDLHDFPMADNLHFLILKAIGWVARDAALTYNLYLLLTFPLTTLTSLFAMRRLGASYVPALFGSLLFTFLPYHFFRSLFHAFLAGYFLVPLVGMVLLGFFSERAPFFAADPAGRLRWRWGGFESIAAGVICVLVASTGVYYALFACFFLLFLGLCRALERRSLCPLASASLLTALTGLALAANLAPSLLYRWQHGPNPQAVLRLPAEAEIYGLKVTQLLLPVSHHRLPALAALKDRYNASPMPLVNENDFSTLGAVGSVGFLVLAGWFFYGRLTGTRHPLLDGLSLLTAAGVLLATVGGLGSLFSLLVTPLLRGYSRISVYLAFFSLFTVVFLLERALRTLATTTPKRIACYTVVGLLLAAGIWDQTPTVCSRPYDQVKAEYQHDAEFVQRIEAAVPPGAMIFQLPYLPFPICPPRYDLHEYDLFRGYLHARALRWSYGCMMGRAGDEWLASVAALPPEELVKTLAFAGFAGVYVDRAGFADRGRELEGELGRSLGVKPMQSGNGRYAFFDLGGYRDRLRQRYSDRAWLVRHEAALHPLGVRWGPGFYEQERLAGREWHWCSSQGELQVRNPWEQERTAVLRMVWTTGREVPAHLGIASPLLEHPLQVGGCRGPVAVRMRVPPGCYPVRFSCDAPRVEAPQDTRALVFRVEDFTLEAAE